VNKIPANFYALFATGCHVVRLCIGPFLLTCLDGIRRQRVKDVTIYYWYFVSYW